MEQINPTFDYPIDKDNEALITANIIKNADNRNFFVRQGNWQSFRYKEFQTISWAIIEAENEKLSIDPDIILLKSKSCPVRYLVTFEFLNDLINNFNEVPLENFKTHIEKLVVDKVKSDILEKTSSIVSVCTNPAAKLSSIDERLTYLKEIVGKGFSASKLEFKGMDELVPEYILKQSTTTQKYTTGFRQLDALLTTGFAPGEVTTVAGLASAGKCLGKGTEVMMSDGTFKKVENIQTNDLLMGPDSKPRKVLGTTAGVSKLYKIKQKRGEDYIVNENHILSLKEVGKPIKTRIGNNKKGRRKTIGWKEGGAITNIEIKDYLLKSEYWRDTNVGYRAKIKFIERSLKLDPYFVGIWLGDGFSRCQSISNIDIEIRNYLNEYAKKLNMQYVEREDIGHNGCYVCTIKRNNGKESNYIKDSLKHYNLLHNKHIPDDYKYNTKENRMQLLAGLLDSDGHMTQKVHEISTKYEEFKDDILYLARSLGFYATASYSLKRIKSINFEGYYWRIFISGNNHEIPIKVQRKKAGIRNKKNNPLYTGIKVEEIGNGEYYGFELDQDGLFLLKDFTVTHNSSLALSIMKNLANKKIYNAQFALEMNRTPLLTKLIAFNSRISISQLVGNINDLTEDERNSYNTEVDRLTRNKYIFLDDKPMQSIRSMREQIMLLQDHVKQEYIVVVVDLFGKIKEFQTSDNFARDYEKNANKIQQMVKELGIHAVLVTQIRKDVASRKFSRPTMNDLKNAGALTEISDIILGIHRPYYNPEVAMKSKLLESIQDEATLFNDEQESMIIEENMNKNIAEVIILKQRMGENNVLVNFIFDPHTTCFVPIDHEHQKEINKTKTDLIGEVEI